MRKTICVYLKSGQSVKFKAKNFTINHKNGECVSWKAEGLTSGIWFNPSEVIGFKSS
jgi:hypothetical protein